MIQNKKILETKRQKKIQSIIQEDQERKRNVLTNRELLRREESDFREGILLYQRDAVGRSLEKEKASSLKRMIAQ